MRMYAPAERRKFYEQLVNTKDGPRIRVDLVGEITGVTHRRVAGFARKFAGEYLIVVSENFGVREELRALAHEWAHIEAGHCVEQTRAERAHAIRTHDQWLGGMPNPGIAAVESTADRLGERRLAQWRAEGIQP